MIEQIYTTRAALFTPEGALVASGGLAACDGLPLPDGISVYVLEIGGTTGLVHDTTTELHLRYAFLPEGKGARITLHSTAPGVWESEGEAVLVEGEECMIAGRFEITDKSARTFYFVAALYDRGGLV